MDSVYRYRAYHNMYTVKTFESEIDATKHFELIKQVAND